MFGGYIERMMEMEYIFEFGRKMVCPHCKNEIAYVKGYMGRGQGPKMPIAGSVVIYVMTYICPNCESILNVDQVGSGNRLFGGQ